MFVISHLYFLTSIISFLIWLYHREHHNGFFFIIIFQESNEFFPYIHSYMLYLQNTRMRLNIIK